MSNSIKAALRFYLGRQIESYSEIFGKNAVEVAMVTNATQLTTMILFAQDWRKHGFKKAFINNTIYAGGLVAYYVLRTPSVETRIIDMTNKVFNHVK